MSSPSFCVFAYSIAFQKEKSIPLCFFVFHAAAKQVHVLSLIVDYNHVRNHISFCPDKNKVAVVFIQIL